MTMAKNSRFTESMLTTANNSLVYRNNADDNQQYWFRETMLTTAKNTGFITETMLTTVNNSGFTEIMPSMPSLKSVSCIFI
jgi:hypothetical protein